MMVQLGIFSPTESELISERQTFITAMALALRGGARPTSAIMTGNRVDLMKVVTLDPVTVFKIMEEMGIDKDLMDRAKGIADEGTVVDMQHDLYDMPMIGQIQSAYLGRPDLVQAALALQHSVRASNAIYRLQNGEPDKDDYTRRREFAYTDLTEDPRLEDAVGIHYEVSLIEKDQAIPGDRMDMSAHFHDIRRAFGSTIDMLDEAARGEDYNGVSPKLMKLSAQVHDIATHCLTRIGANEPMEFDMSRELGHERDPLTDPDFEIPEFLRSGPNRGDRDVEL